MKKLILLLIAIASLLLTGCTKPNPFPKKPNYKIEKPKQAYSQASQENLQKMVPDLQGKPYVWAEEGPSTFDCSGFTYYMYGRMGVEIPRVARAQARVGKSIQPYELKYGDLLFFNTDNRKSSKVTHVGMYLGNGWFTHASTKKHEVVYTNIYTSKYYKDRLLSCKRYLKDEQNSFFFAKNGHNQPSWSPSSELASQNPTADQLKKPLKLAKAKKRKRHFIQVLAYTGKLYRSDPILKKIKKQKLGYKKIAKNNRMNLVVGPFRNKNEARRYLKRVRSKINKEAFPTTYVTS